MSRKKLEPWKRRRPKGSKRTRLSASDKKQARASAKKAARPYPNLVDNMRMAHKKRSARCEPRTFVGAISKEQKG